MVKIPTIKMPKNWKLIAVFGVIGYLLYRNIHRGAN